MQFESKVKRQYWINSVLGLIPDLIIAAIITAILGGYIGTFILVTVGLQVLYFLVWLRKTIWGWIVFGVGQETSRRAFDRLLNGERVS